MQSARSIAVQQRLTDLTPIPPPSRTYTLLASPFLPLTRTSAIALGCHDFCAGCMCAHATGNEGRVSLFSHSRLSTLWGHPLQQSPASYYNSSSRSSTVAASCSRNNRPRRPPGCLPCRRRSRRESERKARQTKRRQFWTGQKQRVGCEYGEQHPV